jgi:hypothetical protein
MHSSTGKTMEFTLDFVTISDMNNNPTIVFGEENHQYHLYIFIKFIAKYGSPLLLMCVDHTSILWHERFGHISFKYIHQQCKQDIFIGFPNIHFSKGFSQEFVLENILKISLRKGRLGGPPLL